MTCDPDRSAPSRSPPPGHDRPREAEPGGLRSRRSRPRTGRSSPRSDDLAAGDGAGRDRPVALRGGERQRERQVERRAPSTSGRRRGRRRRPDRSTSRPARRPSTATSSASRSAVEPGQRPAWWTDPGRRDERLDLDEQRAGCPRGWRRPRPRAPRAWSSPRNARAGSGTSRRPAPVISRTPISSVEPKRFLALAAAAARRTGRPRARARHPRGARACAGRRGCRPW